MEEEIKSEFYPIEMHEPQEEPLPAVAPVFDPPEKIIQDILKTEKELADETMQSMRVRHERERAAWERLYEQKERDMVALRNRLSEAEERIKKLVDQASDGRQIQLEQLRMNTREMELRRQSDTKKWETIADEIRTFRQTAQEAQEKLAAEQEQVRQLKKTLAVQETAWKEQVRIKEDELMDHKEHVLKAEETLLTLRAESGEKTTALQEEIQRLQTALADERQQNARINENKDRDLEKLQKGLQDAVIQINAERQKNETAQEKIIELQRQVQDAGDELQKTMQASETQLLEWKKSWQEEQSAWEKNRQEFVAKEESLRKDLEEQLKRVNKTLHIAEAQLAEEQRVRHEHEEAVQTKDAEIARMLQEKDETVKQWKGMLNAEQDASKKRFSDMNAEFGDVQKKKDDEIAALRLELKGVLLERDEERRNLAIEKDDNENNRMNVQRLEEDCQRMQGALENKEKDWQKVLIREQELLQKQIEELRAKNEAQIQSRDMEITRLNEDLNILNGQAHELRQKLSIEKNENDNRLSRIQEFEVQVRMQNDRHNQEKIEWERQTALLKEQIEQQRKNIQKTLDEAETQAKRDMQLYRDKINRLTAQLSEAQRKNDFDRPVAAGSAGTAPAGNRQAPADTGKMALPDSGQSSVSRSMNRYYPGK